MSFSKPELREYFEKTLGYEATVKGAGKLNLPPLIKNNYGLLEIALKLPGMGTVKLLGLVDENDSYPGAVKLKKHIKLVENATNDVIVYISDTLMPSERSSMIEQQINFVAVGRQLHVPEIGISLREAYRQRRKQKSEAIEISPATQAMLIVHIIEGWDADNRFSAADFLSGYKFSRVTLYKAIAELEDAKLIENTNSLLRKVYRFTCSREQMLQKAMPYLRSPVKRTLLVKERPPRYREALYAGETALSRQTMLVAPKLPVYAITSKAYKAMVDEWELSETTDPDQAQAMIEIWSYRPLNIGDGCVDPISLYLSLKEHPDERVQMSLDELKEKHLWMKYED